MACRSYAAELVQPGYDHLTVNELIELRIHGVDTELVRTLRPAK